MTMTSGVPVGAQIAWLSSNRSGCPLDVTRVAPVIHWAVTQGPLAAGGGGSVQPATTYGVASVTVGWPLTVTRGFGTVGCAWPPWAHKHGGADVKQEAWHRCPAPKSPPARRC